MKTNKSFCNYGKNLICFVLTLFMAMPVFPSSQDEEDIKGPSHFSTVRTDSSLTQRRFRSDSEGDISASEASSDGGRPMHETKQRFSRAHKFRDGWPSSDSESNSASASSDHGEDLPYSQSSEAQFLNFTFKDFLQGSGTLLRYQTHGATSSERTWRENIRKEFLDEVVAFIQKSYDNNEHNIQNTLCTIGNEVPAMTAVLYMIHRHAINAYGEDIFGGNENLSNIGTYRHTFCRVYIETLQNLAPDSTISQLEVESSYHNGVNVQSSTIGSVRPDVYWKNRGIVFDFKNFSGSVTDREVLAWATHLPLYHSYESIEEEV